MPPKKAEETKKPEPITFPCRVQIYNPTLPSHTFPPTSLRQDVHPIPLTDSLTLLTDSLAFRILNILTPGDRLQNNQELNGYEIKNLCVVWNVMNGACLCGPDKEQNYTVLNERNCGSVLELVRERRGMDLLVVYEEFPYQAVRSGKTDE